jgi:4-hydroxythreonine-4-phosphate dehydrogenase
MKNKPVIAITAGDPCGIGPEIVLKAITDNAEISKICSPVVFCKKSIIKQTAKKLNIDAKFHVVQNPEDKNEPENYFALLDIDVSDFDICWGKICAAGGDHAFKYIDKVISFASEGRIDAIVTAPINKEAMKLAQIPYLDHTEMFSRMTNSPRPMTLFITGRLRIFFLTRHIALRDVADSLDENIIVSTAADCITHLKKIGIKKPRLAIAALNPHGGEHGLFGREEMEVIEPAVQKARQKGLTLEGPVPADSVFQLAKEGNYDGVLSLYHDQGHIAAKTYDFYRTISMTMGLPFLRTSVDHGTAMQIAGQNSANPLSMIEAIKAAVKYHW